MKVTKSFSLAMKHVRFLDEHKNQSAVVQEGIEILMLIEENYSGLLKVHSALSPLDLVREAIESHRTGEIRLIDVYQEVQKMRQEIKDIQAVAVVEDTPREELKEPADIAAALDGLGL